MQLNSIIIINPSLYSNHYDKYSLNSTDIRTNKFREFIKFLTLKIKVVLIGIIFILLLQYAIMPLIKQCHYLCL
jgi:antibiotic biosynthesis monooxygenase (ABM) superfamily enzyme